MKYSQAHALQKQYAVAIEKLTRTVTGPGVMDMAWTRLAVAWVRFSERRFVKADSAGRKIRMNWSNVLKIWHGTGRPMTSLRTRMMDRTGCLPHLKCCEQG